jgi:hypothetical protein
MAERLLPPAFSDLEPWVAEWCLDSEPERYAKRLNSSMEEIQAFYDAVFPRAEEAIRYLEGFPLDDLPEDAFRLLKLLYSLILMSFPVEIWKQPYIPDTGTAQFELKLEPIP